jgi:hypothetical protein
MLIRNMSAPATLYQDENAPSQLCGSQNMQHLQHHAQRFLVLTLGRGTLRSL